MGFHNPKRQRAIKVAAILNTNPSLTHRGCEFLRSVCQILKASGLAGRDELR